MSRKIIGIIGGTGLDSFPEVEIEELVGVETPYGKPSARVVVGKLNSTQVAFLPRHGDRHEIPPHRIPYKANLYALKSIGVESIVATCVAGSLKTALVPATVVVPDQFVNLTWGRDSDAVEADGSFVHLPMRDPYCECVRRTLIESVPSGAHVWPQGTVAVIQGPRFNTRAESELLIRQGWDLVNMTQYPEGYFAKSLGLCYAVVATITDWDCGLGTDIEMRPDGMANVLKVFRQNIVTTKRVLEATVLRLSHQKCGCAKNVLLEYYKQL